MANQNSRPRLLLSKMEVTTGTDSVPDGANNAILTSGLDVVPVNGNVVSRDLDSATLGDRGSIHTNVYSTSTFEMELAGAGTAGVAPGFATILRSSGMSETVNAGTSVEYDPVSGGFESSTNYIFRDENRHILTASRGTMTASLAKEAIPKFGAELWGNYNVASHTPEPVTDFSAFQIPKPATADNTPTVIIDGRGADCLTFQMESFDWTQGNTLSARNLPGCASIELTDRRSSGRMVITSEHVDVKDWFEKAKSDLTFAVQLIHGTTAGNIVEYNAPAAQITGNPGYDDDDGILTISLDLAWTFVAGDDEWKWTFR